MSVNLSFEGLQRTFVTMKSALTRNTDEDKFVKVSASETVALVSSGEKFMGMVREIDGANSGTTVQDGGYFHNVAYSGTAPSLGHEDLLCSDSETVYDGGGSGVPVHVVKVDTTNKVLSFKLLG